MGHCALKLSQRFAEMVAAEIWRKKVNRRTMRAICQTGSASPRRAAGLLLEPGVELGISAIEADGPPKRGAEPPSEKPRDPRPWGFSFQNKLRRLTYSGLSRQPPKKTPGEPFLKSIGAGCFFAGKWLRPKPPSSNLIISPPIRPSKACPRSNVSAISI
jgi:hypothetical protein